MLSIIGPKGYEPHKDSTWKVYRELPVGRELLETHDTFEAAHLAREKIYDTVRYFGRDDWQIKGLHPWLKKIVCPTCAVMMAAAKVEQEAGRTYNWKAARGECMGLACGTCTECVTGNLCHQRLNCEALAQKHKADAPKAIRPPRVEQREEKKGKAA